MENKNIKIYTEPQDIITIEESLEHSILSKNVILNDFNNNLTTYIVYYLDNCPVGYLAYSSCIDHIDIISIAVNPEFRHKKIATSLFNYLQSNSNNMELFLEVRKSNAVAIALYKSLGFEYLSTRNNYYTSPCEDALIYVKK